MKELSIEEKARRYDEAIINASRLWESDIISRESYEYIFPALKESEDERIRKKLIEFFKDFGKTRSHCWSVSIPDILAWLEKQSKASKVEEAMRDIEQKAKAFTEANKGLTSDEILAQMRGECWSEKHGEQKPADKIEPRFKVGDIIKPKDKGHEPWQIMQVDILNKEYRFKDGYVVHFSQEDAYELVDKKFTAWSEEDEAMCNSIIDTEQQMIEIINGIQKVDEIQKIFTDTEPFKERYYKEIRWLESIKNRLQSKSLWKPTDEQIGALEEAIGDGDSESLISLYNDLKKLC